MLERCELPNLPRSGLTPVAPWGRTSCFIDAVCRHKRIYRERSLHSDTPFRGTIQSVVGTLELSLADELNVTTLDRGRSL